MIRLLKKIVMGFKFNKVSIKGETDNKENIAEDTIKSQPEVVQQALFEPPSVHLTKAEVETLLIMIRQALFKGEHVQLVYDLVSKLQKYYTQLP